MQRSFLQRRICLSAPLSCANNQHSCVFVELTVNRRPQVAQMFPHILNQITETLYKKILPASGTYRVFVGFIIHIQMLITDVYIAAMQKAFVGHRYIGKNTDSLITCIMLGQQFPLKCLIPGMCLNNAYLKPISRIRKQKRKNFFFQASLIVISFRNIIDGFFQMIFEYIVGCEKHHIERLRRL